MQTRPKTSDWIQNLEANKGYLLWLCSRKREKARCPSYSMPSERPVPRRTTVKTAVSADATSLEIANSGIVRNGPNIWMNERTKECFRINEKDEAGVIAVERGLGETPAAPMSAGDIITQLVSMFNVNQYPLRAKHIVVAERRENYMQNFSTLADTLPESRKQYTEKIESAFLFGKKAGWQPEEHPVYSVLAGNTATDGIIRIIEESPVSHRWDVPVGLSLFDLYDFFREATKDRIDNMYFLRNVNELDKDLSKSNHVALCGKEAIRVLCTLINSDDRTRTEKIKNRFGFEVKKMIIDWACFFDLDLLHYGPLDEEYGDHIILLDKERVGSLYLEGCDVEERNNGNGWEVSSTEGLWMENPEFFGIIKNVARPFI